MTFRDTISRLLGLLPALLLAACTVFSKVGPGAVTIKDMTVSLEAPWNRFDLGLPLNQAPGATEVWTRDGITLDTLAFYVGLAEGETVGYALPQSKAKLPPFRAKMLPHEIVELLETTITQDGSAFRLGRLEPAPFAGTEGFRFEYAMTRKVDGLALSGVGYGAVVNSRLYLMTFSAPRSYYYPRALPAVEAVARSVQLKK